MPRGRSSSSGRQRTTSARRSPAIEMLRASSGSDSWTTSTISASIPSPATTVRTTAPLPTYACSRRSDSASSQSVPAPSAIPIRSSPRCCPPSTCGQNSRSTTPCGDSVASSDPFPRTADVTRSVAAWRHVCRLGDRRLTNGKSRLEVEELEPLRVDGHFDLLVRLDTGCRIEAADDRRPPVVASAYQVLRNRCLGSFHDGALDDLVPHHRRGRDLDVREQLRPERLGQEHLAAKPRPAVALDRRVLHVLGPDPERDLSSRVAAER